MSEAEMQGWFDLVKFLAVVGVFGIIAWRSRDE